MIESVVCEPHVKDPPTEEKGTKSDKVLDAKVANSRNIANE